jgi:hypothetical protein
MTRMANEYERADHDRDLRKHEPRPSDSRLTFPQRLALAKLIGYCEGIAQSGALGAELEFTLRANIAEALVQFDMPSTRDCADA